MTDFGLIYVAPDNTVAIQPLRVSTEYATYAEALEVFIAKCEDAVGEYADSLGGCACTDAGMCPGCRAEADLAAYRQDGMREVGQPQEYSVGGYDLPFCGSVFLLPLATTHVVLRVMW